ncbi:MAG: hypothetical protein WA733_20365 [Methylocystis sp.]
MASPVNSTRAQEGRNLALREAAEGQVRGVLDGVHAVSGGDGGAHDGAQCSAGVGLGKAGVFVALVIEEARERIEPGRRHAEIAPQAIVGDGLRESGLARDDGAGVLFPQHAAKRPHCSSCQDRCWKKSGARRGVAIADSAN